MRISIVSGFFLPVPAVQGGATEKAWTRLAEEFSRAGHDVTLVSRSWPDFPQQEFRNGVSHVRVKGYSHSRSLGFNLLKDFLWGVRAALALPPADIVVLNTVSLPVWLGALKPSAGKVVLTTGRIPKGQFRLYRKIALVIVNSQIVQQKLLSENVTLKPVCKIYGFPIDFTLLNTPMRNVESRGQGIRPIQIGFVGRIHREKGISQLIEAILELARREHLPPWSISLCGPVQVSSGGSGEAFLQTELARLSTSTARDRLTVLPPEYAPPSLAKVYQSLDIFVLPSLAENGETFGVANIEAMAAGCAVVTSRLDCFSDYITPEVNALTYDHRATDAPMQLANQIERILMDPGLRRRLVEAGKKTAARYDYGAYSSRLLGDFQSILPN